MARHFNRQQREALYLAADGKCELCGCVLDPATFHADHIDPHSKGGETDVLNGQALCPRCNLEKGARMNLELRLWQENFLRDYEAFGGVDYLLEAWPATGKTIAALIAAQYSLRADVSRIVVVVPYDSLKGQWQEVAAKLGIQLATEWRSSSAQAENAKMYKGVVVTYQQVAASPEAFRVHTGQPTLVIFDEIHHAADDKSWGTSTEHAFQHCTRRLSLTGTAFRSDGLRIPFVSYGDDGRSAANYRHDYGRALSYGDCREAVFPPYGGVMSWAKDGQEYEVAFSEDVADGVMATRLRVAVDTRGEWPRQTLKDAHKKLMELREAEPNAGGLVLAIDTKHAEHLARLVREVTGTTAKIVHMNVADPKQSLDEYRDGSTPWLIAVRMVSEGVDIPRLRVLVYATNVTTELFFRQALGRILRGTGLAYFFFPEDGRLCEYARRIKCIADAQLRDEIEQVLRESKDDATDDTMPESTFMFGGSTGEAGDVITVGGESVAPAELERLEHIFKDILGHAPSPDKMLALARRLPQQMPDVTQAPKAEPVEREAKKLRKIIHRMVNRLVYLNGQEQTQKEINAELAKRCGGLVEAADMDQLRARVTILQEALENGHLSCE